MQEVSLFEHSTLWADHVSHFSLSFVFFMLVQNSDSEAFTDSVGLPNQTLKETGQAQWHLKDRSECRPSTSLIVESGGMGARTHQRGNATASCSPVEEDGGGSDEKDSKQSLVTGGAQTGSSPGHEVVQAEAPTLGEIPCGWMRVKVEPDC
jgi:hypothetical protein